MCVHTRELFLLLTPWKLTTMSCTMVNEVLCTGCGLLDVKFLSAMQLLVTKQPPSVLTALPSQEDAGPRLSFYCWIFAFSFSLISLSPSLCLVISCYLLYGQEKFPSLLDLRLLSGYHCWKPWEKGRLGSCWLLLKATTNYRCLNGSVERSKRWREGTLRNGFISRCGLLSAVLKLAVWLTKPWSFNLLYCFLIK